MESIKKALRKKVELLAKELLEHPEKTDEEVFRICSVMFDLCCWFEKVDSAEKYIRGEK